MTFKKADHEDVTVVMDHVNKIMTLFGTIDANPSIAQAACLLAYSMIGATLQATDQDMIDNAARSINGSSEFLSQTRASALQLLSKGGDVGHA